MKTLREAGRRTARSRAMMLLADRMMTAETELAYTTLLHASCYLRDAESYAAAANEASK